MDRVQAAVEPFACDGKLVAVLGGEHTVSIGAARAFRRVHPDLSVLYLDAHADLRDEYMGSRFSHACAARRILDECPVVEVGMRSISQEEMDFAGREGVPIYFHDLRRRFGGLGCGGDRVAPLRTRIRQHRPGRAGPKPDGGRRHAGTRRAGLGDGHGLAQDRVQDALRRRLRCRRAMPLGRAPVLLLGRRQAGLQDYGLRNGGGPRGLDGGRGCLAPSGLAGFLAYPY